MKIYLASPLGFSQTTLLFMDILEKKIEDMGHNVINPWKLGAGNDFDEVKKLRDAQEISEKYREVNTRIAKRNHEGIDSCGMMFAVLDGADIDSGTASEIGYAFAKGKKVIGFRSDYRQSGENLGCLVNLQVQYWIEKSGGRIVTGVDEVTSEIF